MLLLRCMRLVTVVSFAAAMWMVCASAFLPQPQQASIPFARNQRAPARTMPNHVYVPRVVGAAKTPFSRSNTGPIKAVPNNDKNDNTIPPNPGGGISIDPSTKLLLCILIDIIGIASFAVPGLGEATDVGWAPISAVLVNYLFGNGIFTTLALVEELLPGFDIIPTATIAWFFENRNRIESTTAKVDNTSAPGAPSKRSDDNDAVKLPNISDAIGADIID